MPTAFLCRSLLNTSALQVPRHTRALASGADVVILDLEDAVPPGSKDDARRLALPFFGEPQARCLRGLRINSPRTEAGLKDLLALLEHGTQPDLLVIPKVESAEELRWLDAVLGGRMGAGLLPVIENPRGLHAVEDIACAGPRVRGLIFGAADFAASLGTTLAWESLQYARARLAVAAAHAGIPALDAPCFRLEEPETLRTEIERCRLLGYVGKVAIHPQQVPVLNSGFLPSPAVVAQAREILARSEQDPAAIHVVSGQMIGPPFVQWARRLLAEVEQGSAGNNPLGAEQQ